MYHITKLDGYLYLRSKNDTENMKIWYRQQINNFCTGYDENYFSTCQHEIYKELINNSPWEDKIDAGKKKNANNSRREFSIWIL